MATIQFGGLATGLNTSALIDGLIKVERRSIDLLQLQKVRFQAQQGVFTTLGSKLASLKSAAQALSLSTDFNKRAAASSDTTVLTASADSTAQVGTYNVSITTLAKAKSLQSTSFTSTTATVGTGTLTLTVGSTSTNITVDATNNTLTGLKDAINNSGAAVTASIINVGASTPDYRLVVQSKNTGTANAVTLSGTLSPSVTNSDTTVLTATADSTAQVGTYNISVTTLAKATKIESASFTSATSTIGKGTLTISVGGTNTTVTIDNSNNTLTGLKDAINNSGAAVTASIVNVGPSDYRLVVQGNQTGTANAVTLSSSLTTGGPNPFPGGGTVVQAAADAQFTVDGTSYTRSNNTVSDVITGVTLTLLKKGGASSTVTVSGSNPFPSGGTVVQAAADAQFTVNSLSVTRSSNTVSDVITGVTLTLLTEGGASSTVTVSSDTAAIKSSIQEFVDAYNEVAKIINDQFKLDPTTKKQGALAGDPVLRGVLSRIRATISTPGGQETRYAYLSDIGLRFQKDGTLTVDDAKLTDALTKDPTSVSNLFVSSKNGIGKRVPDAVDDFISLVDGALTSRQNGISTSITGIDKKITSEETRIAALEKRLMDQFTALEKLVSQLNEQSQFLSRQFASSSAKKT